MEFQKLTPVNDAKIGVYEDALDYVFKNDDVLNVAISGPYSSGKSSLIETYKKTHKEKEGCKEFLHISLAHFDSKSENGEEEATRESVLEGQILNQLIQQIDPSKIPQSNFRIKRSHSFRKKVLFSVGIVVFVLLVFYLINFSKWTSFVSGLPDTFIKSVLEFISATQYSRLIGFLIATAIAVIGIYTLINVQLNKGLLKKFSVQGNEIEIFEDDEESYFDKYLNEVLYLFEQSGADVVVFEDIDRYNSVKIFQRLREINTLINRKHKKTIRFFYLLRDDMFFSKDRTKFFDFMIPVVPFVDSSNSYDQILNLFAEDIHEDSLKPEFLQGVSLYIDDMRVLKNICNEYIIYKSRIRTTEQDNNKLLAIIIYKNIFPSDFSELQLNRGFVFNIFCYKSDYIEKEEKRLEANITLFTEEIDERQKECLNNKDEIERLYANPYYRVYGNVNNRIVPQYEAEKNDRIKLLDEKTSDQINDYQRKIELLKKEKASLYDKKLSEIVNRNNIDAIFSVNNESGVEDYAEVIESDYFDLLKYLIRNGYIDETYPDYMSYFYDNSLSREDKVFLRSITDQKAKDFQYKLKNPKKVIERLRPIDFQSEEILNYDLLDYLLKSYPNDHIYIDNFISALKQKNALDFVFGYLSRDKEINSFIYVLCKNWSDVFDSVVESAVYSKNQTHHLALMIVYYSDDALKDVNKNNKLTEYINFSDDFLSIEEPCEEQIIKGFAALNIRFEDIDFEISNKVLLGAVYHNNMYVLCEVVIAKILEYYYGITQSEAYKHENLSLIRLDINSDLSNYVDSNINEYIEKDTEFCEGSISDNEDVVAWALNNKSLTDDNKTKYINCLSVKISDLELIRDLQWRTLLLSKNLVECSIENIFEYFLANGNTYDDVLIDWINQNEISFGSDGINIDTAQQDEMFNATVKCNKLDNNKYTVIIEKMNRYYKSFEIKDIESNKIMILIDLKVIRLSNADVLLFLRQSYPECVIYFIEKNIKVYCESIINKDNFDLKEAINLLSSKIHLNYKLKILSHTNEPIQTHEKGYPEKLLLHIFRHNFDERDLPHILKNNDNYSTACQTEIYRLLIFNLDSVIVEEYPVSYNLLQKAIAEGEIESKDLFSLFSFSVRRFDLSQTKICLLQLKQEAILTVFEGKHPKVQINTENTNVLEVFKSKQWISSFVEEGNEYRIYGKKQ